MSKIEVGEYVRTKKGRIDKVERFSAGLCIWCCENGMPIDECNCVGTHLEDIVKHSKQPIDLIEVKDLVCFKNKLQNSLENEEMIIHIFDNDTLEEVKQAIEKGEIELLEILTKEQYMANCYKVGGEDEC